METGSVNIPTWSFVLLCLLAAWSFFGSLLIPGVRWFFRRRINRVIDEVNRRLQLKIPAFKLTKRQVLIDRLLYDPEVQKAAEETSAVENRRREDVMAEVEKYAKEIVPSFNAYAYFSLGYWVARRFAQLVYRVRLAYADEDGLSKVDPGASVVFIMNHRSNMDYVLVAYLAATKSALSYAVGEWARVWPLQSLIKSLGAYFIRRNSNSTLYRKVLARYVQMATEGGVVQAVYPEGGLTIDGKCRPLKLGLLSYMLQAFDPAAGRDLIFIPVGINYDRVIEDRSLIRKLKTGTDKKSGLFAVKTTLKFLVRNFWQMFKGKWYRFGYAGVNFGSPISMREKFKEKGFSLAGLSEDERRVAVQHLGEELMEKVMQVIPVLPVSITATILLESKGTPLSEIELKVRVQELIENLESAGAHVYIPRSDRDYAVRVGLRMLTLRHMVTERDGLYSIREEEQVLLEYYANSIAHLVPASAKN